MYLEEQRTIVASILLVGMFQEMNTYISVYWLELRCLVCSLLVFILETLVKFLTPCNYAVPGMLLPVVPKPVPTVMKRCIWCEIIHRFQLSLWQKIAGGVETRSAASPCFLASSRICRTFRIFEDDEKKKIYIGAVEPCRYRLSQIESNNEN